MAFIDPSHGALRTWLAFFVLLCPGMAYAGPQSRLQGRIDARRTVTLPTSVRSEAKRARDLGALIDNSQIDGIKILLKQTDEQAAALDTLLEEQRDPGSPNFNRWLTPEEFGDRFGVSDTDIAAIESWLESAGFHIDSVARARNWISFSGTSAQVAAAFHTQLHQLELDGETHFANMDSPQIPEAVSGLVANIQGLDDFRPKPSHKLILNPQADPNYTSGGGHYLSPEDIAIIYNASPLYQRGYDGTGQKIVIGGQTDINLSDIQAFRAKFNLPAKDPQIVLAGTDPGVHAGDDVEAALDIEWAGGVARNATIIYVNSPNVFSSVQYAIDQNLAPIISLSYGSCEGPSSTIFRIMAQQANAQGITWLASSGDSGAAGCDWEARVATHGASVSLPANIPEVTAVGGTEFAETSPDSWSATNNANGGSATGYIPETSWNDTNGGTLAASGGGPSSVFAKPAWQTGVGVPADRARDVPDVSLSASAQHDGYIIYVHGSSMAIGGTSASAPSFAGILTLIDQYLVGSGFIARPGLGNINPVLYNLAGTTGVFHDITTGTNIVPCATGTTECSGGSLGFRAGVGYDLVTGLGSIDALNLASAWSGSAVTIGTTTAVTASLASIATTASTLLTATVRPVSGTTIATGSVAFLLGNTSLGSAALNGSGVATLTVSGSALAVGANSITANYIATGTFRNSSGTVAVTAMVPLVVTTTAVTADPTTILATASSVLTVTIRAATGSAHPGGTVTLSTGLGRSGISLGVVTLDGSGLGTLAVRGSALATGANTITANYSPAAGFQSSSSTVTVTVTAVPTAAVTTTTLTASPASVLTTASTVLTAIVKGPSGSAVPTGTVAFASGSKSLGSVTVGGTGAAALTVQASTLSLGANAVTANFTPTGLFRASSASATVTVTAPPVLTVTSATMTANPATLSQNSSTILTVTVKPATGAVAPAGSVRFLLGARLLGTAALARTGTNGTVAVGLFAGGLALGANTITATYVPTGNFKETTATVALTITAPPTSTTTTLTASSTRLASNGNTVLTVTVRPLTGSVLPSGTVKVTLGSTTLGTVTLATLGGVATGTLTVAATSLRPGIDVVAATYSGATGFNASMGVANLIVTTTPSFLVSTSDPEDSRDRF